MREAQRRLADNGLLQEVVEGVPIRVFWKDRECRYLGCNTLFAHDAGLARPDEIIGRSDHEMAWKDQADLYRVDDLAVMESGEARLGFEEPQTTPDGQTIWLRTSKVPLRDDDGAVMGILGIYEDITARKQIEDQLHASEALSRALIEQSPLAIQILSPDGRTKHVNPSWERMWGVPLAALADYILLEDRQLMDKGVMPLVERGFSGESVVVPEMEYDRAGTREVKGGEGTFWVRTVIYPLTDERGQIREVVVIQEDTTARRRTLDALERSEARFRDLFESSPDPCWIINEENLFTLCNQAAAEVLGYDTIEALQATHPSMLSPEVQPDGRGSFEKAEEMMDIAHAKGVHRFEWEHRRKNGECFPVEVTLARIEIDGRAHLYCVWRDISERKRTEDDLRTSNLHARLLLSLARKLEQSVTEQEIVDALADEIEAAMGYRSAWIVVVDEDPSTGWMLRAGAGDPPTEAGPPRTVSIDGDPYLEMVIASTDPVIIEDARVHPVTDKGMVEAESLRTMVHVPVTMADRRIAVLGCGSFGDEGVRAPTGAQVEFLKTAATHVAVVLDRMRLVRERRGAEERLRASEERFALAMAGANDGLWDWNLETNQVYYSPRWFSMLGYGPEALPPTLETWGELVHADDKEWVLEEVGAYLQGRIPSFEVEMRMYHREGRDVIVLSRASKVLRDTDGAPVRLVGTHVDITERKAAEQAFRHTSDFLGEIIGNAAEGISVLHALNEFPFIRFDLWNDRMTEITGYTMEEINRLGWYETMHPDPELRKNALERTRRMSAGDNLLGEEWEVTTRSGEKRILSISTSTLAREDGSTPVIAMMHDVTERRQAERDLHLAKFVVDNAPLNITYLDADARIRYLNKTGCETLGITEDEARDLTIPDIDPLFSVDVWKEHWQKLKEQRRMRFDTQHRDKNGDVFPVEVIANYMKFGDLELNVAFDQNMTEKRQLEEQLRQSQKMESIGTLVGGIAHDFNNMLAAVQGNVYLAKRQLQDRPAVLDRMQNIEKLTTNAAEMVHQLLTFARKDKVTLQTFQLNSFLRETLKLNRAAIPENIDILSEVGDEPIFVEGDSTQLQQVLMNLFNNARDALAAEASPVIRCTLSRFTADEAFLQHHPEMTARDYARISIEDNGEGIASENMERIFDPFFTTKEVGKGTGLGLAMVYGSVRRHGGVIELVSTPGSGTTFHVVLPVSAQPDDGDLSSDPDVIDGRGETILLVDDNEDMRETIAEVLESLDYTVVQAENGKVALALLNESGRRIDLMLSDVVMPVMGGGDLVEAARKGHPGLPIILATGYERSGKITDMERISGVRVIGKPFNIDAISKLIQSMLDPA